MVAWVKITILDDNTPAEGLLSEWGFSAYVETPKYRILFDADTDPRVIEYNANALNVDLTKLDYAVLSHHHGDHYGGFEYIGRIKSGLKIFIPPGPRDYLERWGLKPLVVSKPYELSRDIWIVGPLKASIFGINEISLAIYVDGKGLIILTGCSHPGVAKIGYEAYRIFKHEIYHIFGGFHNPSRAELDELAKISKYITPMHCSGYSAIEYVRSKYPNKYIELRTGSKLEY